MSNLSYIISALLLLVKFGSRAMKTNKIPCTGMIFSVQGPLYSCAHGLEGADWASGALGLNLSFEEQSPAGDGSHEMKSHLRALITFNRVLVNVSNSAKVTGIGHSSILHALDWCSALRVRQTTQ